ncbi:MAG: hypothetical protein NTW96_05255 [Planctomycetia bacterium]|nr:hypothetical protein [Planctomycetia bacterium]
MRQLLICRPQTAMHHKRIPFVLLLSLACFCGCGPSGPQRVIVSGSVSYRGKPVQQGTIRFVPSGGTQGPASGAVIENGKYEATANGGVIVGTHRVEIIAIAPRKDPMGRDLAAMEGAGTQYLPATYNRQSKLTVTIEPGGAAEHNFDLQ